MDKFVSSDSIIKDIINVMSSNIFSVLSSVITGLIVPKMLGATNYGYYRMFVLYMSYTALLHFGFIDGILLDDGDKDYDQLNKEQYRSNSIIFILIQSLICFILIGTSFVIKNPVYSTLFFTIGIGTFLFNITTYYIFITQIIMHFKTLSILNSLQGLLNIVITLLLWILTSKHILINVNYASYIWAMLFVYFVIFLIYLIIYRRITFGYHDSLILGLSRFVKYCKNGIYLTISYQASNLIMIIDNQIISLFFVASVYGEYSLSYSISNIIMTVISAISPVLFPHLKRDSVKHILRIYHKMISLMLLFIYFSLLAYFPLCVLIKIILPEYVKSLIYLRIFLPELGITCPVTMIIFNYYNALGKSKFYFYMSVVIVLISAIIDSIMALFNNPIMVAFGSFIAIFIWYLISEHFLIEWFHVKWFKNLIYIIFLTISFFVSSMTFNLLVGFVCYLLVYLIISLLMFNHIIKKNIRIILNKI